MSATPTSRDLGGLGLLAIYMVGWVGVLLLVGVVTALLLVGSLAAEGVGLEDLGARIGVLVENNGANLPAWVMVVVMGVQLPLMWALVPAAHWLGKPALYKGDLTRARPEGWVGVHAHYRAPGVFYAIALVGGLTVGFLPGWIATELRAAFPAFQNGSLEAITGILTSAPMGWRVLFAVEVGLVAPLVEEWVFRGFMWDALKRFLPIWAVWLLSSFIFAAYHMDPIQSSAVVLTGLALGWVRWMSGSVWPAVVMHAANNTLAVLASQAGGEVESYLSMALAGFAVCSVLMVVAGILRTNRSGALVDSPLA